MNEVANGIGERAASVLGPESDLLEDLDAAGLGQAATAALRAVALHPAVPARAGLRLCGDLARIPVVAISRFVGAHVEPPVTPDPADRRFGDPAWDTNPAFFSIRQTYLALCRYARTVVGSTPLAADTRGKATLALNLLLDAAAPTNLPVTNPAVLKRAFDTAGGSLARGAGHFLDDLVHNDGRPRQVDASGFEVGVNLAATPGRVVYRNELMELIQYEPQTPEVRAVPLLFSPPWINKYYVMDLAPGRSFVEWAVRHGRTVFAISYRNPTREMAGTTMDDYLVDGPQRALDVVQEITGSETTDIVGLCLGGALTAITAAYLNQAGDHRVGALTLLNTMLDYSEPGALGAFTDRRSIERLERKMHKEGGFEGKSMAGTFDVLRANDLIFNYVVSSWLLGQDPPKFDILAWNADSTRMPSAMHGFYLRNFYLENKLALGSLEIAGTVLDLSAIKTPAYVVSAVNDHIVPWESAYKTVGLLSGPIRFVLGNGGHIAGIVSPPSPKAWYLVGPEDTEMPSTGRAWRESAARRGGSWWEDWAAWSGANSGPLAPPPPMGSDTHPALEPAPGRYVRT